MSTAVGRQAELVAAKYLKKLGHQIIAQNWRTRWCEIDVISKNKDTIYFVEVKYRGNNLNGAGLDYITPRKLSQMQYAAEFWLSQNTKHSDYDFRLAAIEISGQDFKVTAYLDDL